MKIYAIHSDVYNWKDTSFFDTAMYHGVAILPSKRKGNASHDLDEKKIKPMRVILNLAYVGEIFIPYRSVNLVISERILDRLSGIKGSYRLTPVTIEKLIHFNENSPDYDEYRGSEMSIFDKAKSVETSTSHPAYYEVMCPNHYGLLDKFTATQKVFTANYPGERMDLDELPVSNEMFADNPITNAGFPLLREDLYQRLAPYLDTPYFGIKELDIA